MAVSIIHNLLPVHFSQNAVEVRFSTPDKVVSAGAKNRCLIIFSSYPTTSGDTLVVEYVKDGDTYTRTFTFEASPDADAYEIPIYPGSGLVDWLYQVVAGLQADPNLATDWIVGLWDDNPIYGVLLQAQFEDDTNITFAPTGFSLTTSYPTSGSVGEAEENYRLSVWLYLGRNSGTVSTAFDRSPEIELDADQDNKVELNLQGYLADMLYDYEPIPTSSAPVECTAVNRPAYLLFGQKWGDPIERNKNYKSEIFRVIKGGLNPRIFAEEKDDLPGWLNQRFLTNRYERVVQPKQSDYLYWLCNEKLTNVKVMGEVIFPVGPSIASQEETIAATEIGRTYKLKVAPNSWYILFANDDQVVRFNVWLAKSDNTPITQKVVYQLDKNYLDCIFEYENSLGVIESWKFRGERSIGHKISKSLYRTKLPFSAEAQDTEQKSYNERSEMTMKITTGPLSLSESKAFSDFLRSRYIWLVHSDGKFRVRIPQGKHIAESWNLRGNHARGGEFTVELGEV